MTGGRVLALAIVSVLLGAWGGYALKVELDEAAVAKQSQAAVKKSAQNVVVSVAESARIETEVAKVDTSVASIKTAIVKRGVTLYKKQETNVADSSRPSVPGEVIPGVQPTAETTAGGWPPSAQGACSGGTDFVLDLFTVRMLDAARQGRGLGAAGSSDEAQPAPSTVGVTDLISNDLDIVRMYHDLAKRHDELVDAVEKRLKEQAD